MPSINDLTLADIMSPRPHILTPNQSLAEAMTMLAARQVSCLAVMRDGEAVGILTERDMVHLFITDTRLETPVVEIMSTPAVTAASGLDFRSAYHLLLGHHIRHLLVVDEAGHLVGVVSETDFHSHLGLDLFQKTQDLRSAMETRFVALPQESPLGEAIRHMGEFNCDFVLALNGEQVCGIITERDVPRLLVGHADPHGLPLWEVMSSPLKTVPVRNSLAETAERMSRERIRHMAVMDEQCRIVGVLSQHRLLERLGGVIIEQAWEDRRSAELARIHTRLLLEIEHEFARLLNDEPDRESILQAMLNAALRLPELDGGALFKRQWGGIYSLIHQQGLSSSLVDLIRELPFDSPEIEAIRQGSLLCGRHTQVPPCEQSKLFASQPAKEAGIQTIVLLPLRAAQETLACLYLVSRQKDLLAPDTMTALDTLNRQFSLALEKLTAIELARSRQHALRHSESLLRAVVNTIPDLIWLKDMEGIYLACNPTFERFFGAPESEIIGKTDYDFVERELADFFRANDRAAVAAGGSRSNEEWLTFAADGYHGLFETVKTPMYDDNNRCIGVLGVARDISERKRIEAQLHQLAHFDPLTHLPNRALLSDRLLVATAQTKRNDKLLAVCYLDLDGFKPVNDRHGHEIGDRLLIEVAARLRESLRGGDSVGRLGGDEFVLLLGGLDNENECHVALERILKRLSAPYRFDGLELILSASVGVTLYPSDATDSDTLLRHADQAMYEAKDAGRNRYHFFDARRDQRLRVIRESQQHIRQALSNGEMTLHYQPKANMRHGHIYGVEALIRWRHPQRGLIQPLEFLPQISETDIAVEIDLWVMEQALQQTQKWRETSLPLTVSVNVGARTLGHGDFQRRLTGLLARYPALPRNTLEVEILESVALDDIRHVSTVMEQCRKLGVGFALDDFGTGYSSLLYLRHLPASMLKVDQSFVRDMLDDTGDLNIIEGIIGLADAFQCDVIAEGVEGENHGILLLQLGCSLAQGYGIARPMAAAEVPEWIDQYRQPACWSPFRDFSGPHPDAPLLLMSMEHKRWVAEVITILESDPPVDFNTVDLNLEIASRECRFGHWYHGPGRHRYGQRTAFQKIEAIHERVHQIAAQLIELWRTGRLGRRQDLLEKLLANRDLLLSYLENLREYP